MWDNLRVRVAGLGPVALRLGLAATFMTHGWGKMVTLFHGGNPVIFLADKLPYIEVLGWVVGITEFVGGACILLGLLTRFWSAGLVINMAVAIAQVHWPQGFKMHGIMMDTHPGVAGFEWPFSLACMAFGLFLLGPGALSLDYLIGRIFRRGNANAVVGCGMRLPARSAGRDGAGGGSPRQW